MSGRAGRSKYMILHYLARPHTVRTRPVVKNISRDPVERYIRKYIKTRAFDTNRSHRDKSRCVSSSADCVYLMRLIFYYISSKQIFLHTFDVDKCIECVQNNNTTWELSSYNFMEIIISFESLQFIFLPI